MTRTLCRLLAFGAAGALLAGAGRAGPRRQFEPLAIIVNRGNPATAVDRAELRRLLLGERSRWANGRRVTIVMREAGAPERLVVLQQVYGMSESTFRRYFLHAVYTGDVSDAPRELTSPNGVMRFVFNVPGAIGYVRAGDADSTVKVIAVDGLLPGDPGYPLLVPEP